MSEFRGGWQALDEHIAKDVGKKCFEDIVYKGFLGFVICMKQNFEQNISW